MNEPELGFTTSTFNPITKPESSVLLERTFLANIPCWVVNEIPGLTHYEHRLLLMLSIYGSKNPCFYRNKTLAQRLNTTTQSIKTAIWKLKDKGYLTVLRTEGKRYLIVQKREPCRI